MKFNLGEMKINLAPMKFNLVQIKFNLEEMKFNLTLMKLISYFLLAIFIFWHNFKKFSFFNSYNMLVLLVTNNINIYIYSKLIGDPVFRPNIMET